MYKKLIQSGGKKSDESGDRSEGTPSKTSSQAWQDFVLNRFPSGVSSSDASDNSDHDHFSL